VYHRSICTVVFISLLNIRKYRINITTKQAYPHKNRPGKIKTSRCVSLPQFYHPIPGRTQQNRLPGRVFANTQIADCVMMMRGYCRLLLVTVQPACQRVTVVTSYSKNRLSRAGLFIVNLNAVDNLCSIQDIKSINFRSHVILYMYVIPVQKSIFVIHYSIIVS